MKRDEKSVPQKLLRILENESRLDPPCSHVKEECGGCLLQSFDYAAQVRGKEALLEEVYGKPVMVHPASSPLGYRSRMDYVTAFGKVGLRKRGKFAHVVDLNECLLLPDHAQPILRIAKETFAEANIADYNYVRHEGFLRYLTIRTSPTTKECMLILTTTSPSSQDDRARFVALLERIHASAGTTGILWTINDSKTDVAVGEPYWHTGKDWILDEIGCMTFRVFPTTFFQGNPVMAGYLFEKVASLAKGKVLDLCCGVGVIGLLAARGEMVDVVVGVDNNAENIRAAQGNAVLNGMTIDRCRFVCADAGAYLRETQECFDTVICDPARTGLGPQTATLLRDHGPKRIIYVSCNPRSHVEDMAVLSSAYDLAVLEGWDLFPQTAHVEVLSVLERKECGGKVEDTFS